MSKTKQKPLLSDESMLHGLRLLHEAAMRQHMSKLKRRGIKSLQTKSTFKGWEMRIFAPLGYNIYLHAATMARAEFGCVSSHELSLLARLRPPQPAYRQ